MNIFSTLKASAAPALRGMLAGVVALTALTSCLDETFPTSYITADQLEASPASLAGQNNAMAASMMAYGSSYSMAGYPSLMIWRDCLVDELPIYSSTYDYFSVQTKYMGDGALYTDYWFQYYNTIHQANVLISLLDPNTTDATARQYLGNALGYRAWAYLEAAQMWEYKPCGVASLDDYATQRGIYGLTVPIVDEHTSYAAARQNARAPFFTMYRFIHHDLERAAASLDGFTRTGVNQMNTTVIQALAARFWLVLGTRFEQSPTDLQQQLAHEADADGYGSLGITTAADCYARAAEAARSAIAASGEPTSRDEWYDAQRAFNTYDAARNNWIFGIAMVADDNTGAEWKNFVSFMSPEAQFGVANLSYEAIRLCDASLFSRIPESDWRRDTWIAPDVAGTTDAVGRYGTTLSADDFASLPSLTGLKFHPKAGHADAYKEGAAIDLPLIRVEEMYYILAEAVAHTDGLAAGAAVLDDFTNTYRYDLSQGDAFQCPTSDFEAFNDALIEQKRIEFWGEGIVYWDYKRLNHKVYRKYEGSNHPSSYQYNYLPQSHPGAQCCRWLNIYLPSKEYSYNSAIFNDETGTDFRNPDPSYVDGMEY